MAPVTFDAVRKEYEDGVAAVHGVDLAVADGEFVVLVGPSGCGKSTTLRMVAGLESITAGMLRIGDRVVNDVPPAERDVAMVFQSYALYPHMTVRENLGFALRLRKRPKAEIAARVQAVAETLGLADLLDRMPRQLSGGQRQRVAIGRAIVREPRVFLFDEPLSNLDAKLRAEMRREIAALHRRLGATMLYVTHDQVEAMTLGDRVVVMSAGHVRQVDTPAALYARPRDTFVAGFLGSPPMNLLPGRLTRTDDRVSVELDGTGVRLALPAALARGALAGEPGRAGPDGRVVVGVRPEHLRVGSAAEPPDGDVVLPAAVELVEPLGHEQLVHLRHGRSAVVARTAPEVRPPDGGAVTLRAAGERLHLFDAATGVAIDPA